VVGREETGAGDSILTFPIAGKVAGQ
jgi:hypothetical protein